MGSMDIDKVFERISLSASPYTAIVRKTLQSLWIGSAGVESSKMELTLTATVLINEICSVNDLPPSEILIAEDALLIPSNTEEESCNKLESESGSEPVIGSEFMLPPTQDIHCPVVDSDLPSSNVITTLTNLNNLNNLTSISPKQDDSESVATVIKNHSTNETVEESDTEFLCHICKSLLPNYEQVLKHCASDHPGLKVPVLKLLHGDSKNASSFSQSNLSEDLIFQCIHCQTDFKTEEDLKEHILLTHQILPMDEIEEDGVHPCDGIHEISTVSEKMAQCDACNQVFTSIVSMKQHILTVHPKDETPYECIKCNKKFRHCSNYLRHKMHSHGSGKHEAEVRPKPFKCMICDKAWMYKYLLEEHNRIVHQDLKSTYSCETCGKEFGRANNLKKHKDTVHATSFDFICDYCGKAYPIKQYLRTHIRDFHSDIPSAQELLENSKFKFKKPPNKLAIRRTDSKKRYGCLKCDKMFAHRYSLDSHISNVHEGIKPYCCHLCGKSISTRANLRLHILRHDENRPKFVCELCGKEFLNKQTLKEHVLYSHEKAPKPKNYACETCEKKFWLKKELNKHVKLVHNKIYDYKCEFCVRSFGTATHLKTHKKTVHDKIYEYKCHLCPVEYGHPQSLKKHLVSVHSVTDYMPPKRRYSKV